MLFKIKDLTRCVCEILSWSVINAMEYITCPNVEIIILLALFVCNKHT